jgi:hypothetical protein
MCLYYNFGIVLMNVCCGFWSVDLILFLMALFWLFVTLVELLGLCMLSLLFLRF